jgi:hypothetical protein
VASRRGCFGSRTRRMPDGVAADAEVKLARNGVALAAPELAKRMSAPTRDSMGGGQLPPSGPCAGSSSPSESATAVTYRPSDLWAAVKSGVRFDAHSGLKSDNTVLPKSTTSSRSPGLGKADQGIRAAAALAADLT